MTTGITPDRPTKRRLEILLGRYTLNPLVRLSFRLGVTPPGMALVETVGRRTGEVRHTPVFAMREGSTVWLIAQHGAHAGWVKNFQARPEIRMRLGRTWVNGVAALEPDDDVRARTRSFAKTTTGQLMMLAMFRTLESQPVSARVVLSDA